jgi:GST-like protein
VLEDGTVLTESAAILIHLGLLHPASGLLPGDPPARALALRGLVYIAANCYAAIGVIDHPERWLAGNPDTTAAAQESLRKGARRRLHQLWDVFADEFDQGQLFLGGDAPNALDLLAVVVSRWSGTRPHLKRYRPRLYELLLRVQAHPMLAPVMQRHWPEVAAGGAGAAA